MTIFSWACSDRTMADGFKLKEDNFALEMRNTFFTLMIVRHQNRLCREAVDPHPLKSSSLSLDGTLSNLIK